MEHIHTIEGYLPLILDFRLSPTAIWRRGNTQKNIFNITFNCFNVFTALFCSQVEFHLYSFHVPSCCRWVDRKLGSWFVIFLFLCLPNRALKNKRWSNVLH